MPELVVGYEELEGRSGMTMGVEEMCSGWDFRTPWFGDMSLRLFSGGHRSCRV